MEAVCPTGRLLAEVPQPARGFRLKTAQLNVVDLGHRLRRLTPPVAKPKFTSSKGRWSCLPGPRQSSHWARGEAAVVQGSAPPQLMAASAEAFTSMFEFQQRSLASEAFRYEQWQFANAQLNQDPSLVVHLDFENLSSTDWTLRNAAEKNRSVPEATIVGCVRAEGRWREKQALEFQSVNDRVRLAVPGDFDALTLSAWVCVKGLDRQFNSLFMCDGFDPGTIHWLIRNDGVLGLTVFGPALESSRFWPALPCSRWINSECGCIWRWSSMERPGKWSTTSTVCPVSRHALKFGPPFRVGSAELGNWNARSGPDPAPLPDPKSERVAR